MNYAVFWDLNSYGVVGNSALKKFPFLTYQNLIRQGKIVYPVDPVLTEIEGQPVYANLESLPEKIDGVILEIPREECLDRIQEAAGAGIRNIWIHQRCESPEALEWGAANGLQILHGTCAVMYLTSVFNAHGIHRAINKILVKY